MMNRLSQIIGRILCFLGIHKMKRGIRYSHNKERYDECLRSDCTFGYWRRDEKSYNLHLLNKQMQKETRRVLVEKKALTLEDSYLNSL